MKYNFLRFANYLFGVYMKSIFLFAFSILLSISAFSKTRENCQCNEYARFSEESVCDEKPNKAWMIKTYNIKSDVVSMIKLDCDQTIKYFKWSEDSDNWNLINTFSKDAKSKLDMFDCINDFSLKSANDPIPWLLRGRTVMGTIKFMIYEWDNKVFFKDMTIDKQASPHNPMPIKGIISDDTLKLNIDPYAFNSQKVTIKILNPKTQKEIIKIENYDLFSNKNNYIIELEQIKTDEIDIIIEDSANRFELKQELKNK